MQQNLLFNCFRLLTCFAFYHIWDTQTVLEVPLRYTFSRVLMDQNVQTLIPLLRTVEGCAKISMRESNIFIIFSILPSENTISRHYVKSKIRASTLREILQLRQIYGCAKISTRKN